MTQRCRNLTTLLHKCLLEGWYQTASQVLGMLLRTKVKGHYLDLRKNDYWRSAAEILLRRSAQQNEDEEAEVDQGNPEYQRSWYTEQGFQDAKKHYEWLIIQYPFSKQQPDVPSAWDFYPALMGLWIHHVRTKSKNAQAHRERSSSRSRSLESTASERLQNEGVDNRQSQARDSDNENIVTEQIREAKEIESRLAGVVAVPPYDRHEELVALHGDVCYWIADLRSELFHSESESEEWRKRAEMVHAPSGRVGDSATDD